MPNLSRLPPLLQQLPDSQAEWQQFLNQLSAWQSLLQGLAGGYSGTVATAKLTSGGTAGSMTFKNGILTESTPAT